MAIPRAPGADALRVTPHSVRLAAFAADVLFVLVAVLVPGVIAAGGLVWGTGWGTLGFLAIFLLIFALAFISLLATEVWLTGQTVGKAMRGLTVRRLDGAAPARTPAGLGWATARQSVGYLVVDVFGLGTLVSLANRRHRCLHDYAFGSEVLGRSQADDPSLPRTTTARLTDFKERLETASEELRERYGWAFSLWRWQARFVAVLITLLLFVKAAVTASPAEGRERRRDAREEGAQGAPAGWSDARLAAAPRAAETPPSGGLSTAATVGLFMGTAAVTAAVAAGVALGAGGGGDGPEADGGQDTPTSAPPPPTTSGQEPSLAGDYEDETGGFQLFVTPADGGGYHVTWTTAETFGTDPSGCEQNFGPDTDPAEAVVTGEGSRYEGRVVSVSLSGGGGSCFYQTHDVTIEVVDQDTLRMCGGESTTGDCPTYRRME
ncbi:RDD family protein [Streptomyces sp. LX-29]|uniref:RDD family protein n=1 Tax=Streptomyces sp. LX-29 TaxID=2900152 RepID=UPI00240DD593|nr:RDD family protein [Streptomyces sp. LX-29]WFB07828.1 RDD family protein [Streptomyces sp. LX-29]